MKAALEGVAMQSQSKHGLPGVLAEWMANNPNQDKAYTSVRHSLIARTAAYDDMPRAWRELEKKGINAMHFMTIVESSVRNAGAETKKQLSSEFDEDIATVKRLISDLRTAIKRSPLPAKFASHRELRTPGLPAVNVMMGWRDIDALGEFHKMYALSVFDMLDVASELLDDFVNSQVPRAVLRRAKRPEITAFVRWLGWRMRQEFKCELPATLARVTNALYNPADPLDKESVKDILRTAPAPFQNNKGVSKTPKNLP